MAVALTALRASVAVVVTQPRSVLHERSSHAFGDLTKRAQSLELRDDASPAPRKPSIRSRNARKEATMPAPRGPKAPPIDIAELRDHIEDALDHWFAGTRNWLPAVDLIRGPSEILMRADLPGVKRDDLRIDADGDTLTISGERPHPDLAGDWAYLRDERRCGPFSRSLALPGRIDGAKVDAKLTDGILEVTLPLQDGGPDTQPVRIRPTR
jgi:HSP20 family molecular chaperone IbpA